MTATGTTLTARTPEDILAMVPVVLGFLPEESVAMLTFGPSRAFHARADLPRARDEIPDLVSALLEPAREHRVAQVFFVIYTDDAPLCAAVARALSREFGRTGIAVIDLLRADGHRWYAATGRRPGVPPWGVPYDVSAHPFLAQAVVDGRVTHASRERLRATLDADPDRVGPVVAALAELTGDPPSPEEDAAWVASTVTRHVRDGTVLDEHDVARLLRGLLETSVRDAAWSGLAREQAPDQVRFWTDVVRRAPGPLVGAPAAVLALAAWVAGHGALAWCAVDRCTEVDEHNSLAELVSDLLTRAVSPEIWETPR
jgi:hypothetical protein